MIPARHLPATACAAPARQLLPTLLDRAPPAADSATALALLDRLVSVVLGLTPAWRPLEPDAPSVAGPGGCCTGPGAAR